MASLAKGQKEEHVAEEKEKGRHAVVSQMSEGVVMEKFWNGEKMSMQRTDMKRRQRGVD